MSSLQNDRLKNNQNHDHPFGKSLNVLKFDANDTITINDEFLENLFQHPEVKNRKLVAFSIIGAYRKGKSFFLDYCLRYLYAHYSSVNCPGNPESNSNWMGYKDEPLKGFSWRTGSARDTTGIIVWSDVFLHTNVMTGEDIAIIVMDTQGLFDTETSPTENSRIFALGTLVSSIQVLNLTSVVQEDQLQYLQFATEFARFAATDKKGWDAKPFQNLTFLIRDWVNSDDFDYGFEGGMEYLESFLKIKDFQVEELKSVRQFIRNSFEHLSCALLPHPGNKACGRKVKNSVPYDGNWGDMDEEFAEELTKVIETLLKPENLVIKKINDEELTAKDYLKYTQQYFMLFKSGDVPEAQTIYESTVQKNMDILVDLCYKRYIEVIVTTDNLLTRLDQIPIFHANGEQEALLLYETSSKMGNENHKIKYKKVLEKIMQSYFRDWISQSEARLKYIEEEKTRMRKELQERNEAELKKRKEDAEALEKILAEMKLENDKILLTEKKSTEAELARKKLEGEKKLSDAKIKVDDKKRESSNALQTERNKTEEEIKNEKEQAKGKIDELNKKKNVEIDKLKSEEVKAKQNRLEVIRKAREASNKKRIEAAQKEKEKNDAIQKKIKTEQESEEWKAKYNVEFTKGLWKCCNPNSGLPTGSCTYVGNDPDGHYIYLARAICSDMEVPAKFIPTKKYCSISFNGSEIRKGSFWVLTGGSYQWKKPYYSSIPSKAQTTGVTPENEDIYIARIRHEGCLIPGKVIGNQKYIYIPFGEKEVCKTNFDDIEFLVKN